ncbi:MAG: CBS domain-containing protein [Candidatus Methanospirareceae archaeon]
MQTDVPIKEVMVRDVVKADMNMDVAGAARMMIKYDVDSIVVLNNGEPVGIVTERDMIRVLAMKDAEPSAIKLKDIMASPLITVDPNESIFEVARKMAEKRIKRMPVVENGKLVGIVADVDIISVSLEMNSILSELIEMNIEREMEEGLLEEDFSQGICEKCGSFSNNLEDKDGLLLCESCKES